MAPFNLASSTNFSLTFAFTSTSVDLKLTVDVALVHQGVKNVKDAVDVPDLWVISQEFDLLL